MSTKNLRVGTECTIDHHPPEEIVVVTGHGKDIFGRYTEVQLPTGELHRVHPLNLHAVPRTKRN